jgi:hypothetical protein
VKDSLCVELDAEEFVSRSVPSISKRYTRNVGLVTPGAGHGALSHPDAAILTGRRAVTHYWHKQKR